MIQLPSCDIESAEILCTEAHAICDSAHSIIVMDRTSAE